MTTELSLAVFGAGEHALQRWFPFTAKGITVAPGKGKLLRKNDRRKYVRSWTQSKEKSHAVYMQKSFMEALDRRGDNT